MTDDTASERVEQLGDPIGGRCLAGPVLVVEGKLTDPGICHRLLQLALDQRVDEQCHVEAEAEGVDAVVALQLDGTGRDHALEGGVATLEARLSLVGGERSASVLSVSQVTTGKQPSEAAS